MTFVPIEIDKFYADIYSASAQRKRIQLGRIFRHPHAETPYFSDYANPVSVKTALDVLATTHSSYSFILGNRKDVNMDIVGDENYTTADLKLAKTVKELELIFECIQVSQEVKIHLILSCLIAQHLQHSG